VNATPSGEGAVAVIVPSFNAGATLHVTVDSAKDEPGIAELVVVDDGSTDSASVVALAELQAENVRVIHQTNQGPSAATMSGLHATSAPYVMRLDADDLLEPGAVSALTAALDQAEDAAAAWGDVQTFGLTTFRIPTAPSLDPWLLTYTNCIPGAGCLMRRSAVLEAGGWQLRDGWEDWDLWLALVDRGWRGVYVPEVVFRYRRSVQGRHIGSIDKSQAHYEQLRRRHPSVFANRATNRRSSRAPRIVKLAVSLIEILPGLPRRARIQLCELVTHLFWNGGLRVTATMLWQAATWRFVAARDVGEHQRPRTDS
jgi:glycosyltransferase involved in cell wall biosynthesis